MPKAKPKMDDHRALTKAEDELIKDLKDLTKEIKRLKKADFLHVFRNPWKFAMFSFLKGLMVGLGSVIGATILVAIAVYILSKVSVVPVVGGWIEELVQQVEQQVEVQ